MSPSENKLIEFGAAVWIGQKEKRIFSTPRTQATILLALLRFKTALGSNCYFNILDVSCKFVDIRLDCSDLRMRPLKMKLQIMKLQITDSDTDSDSDCAKLENHLISGSLYLSGEATIDESQPTDNFTDKHWILCNQITHIVFTKLVR